MIGNVTVTQAQSVVIPCSHVTYATFAAFSKDELRRYAKSIGVKIGRSKIDVIVNLVESGKASICATLGN